MLAVAIAITLSMTTAWMFCLPVHGTHSVSYSWMGYCCGEKDCLITDISVVMFGKETTVVRVDNVTVELPSSSVKESQDGHTYLCQFHSYKAITASNIRCVFYTVGG